MLTLINVNRIISEVKRGDLRRGDETSKNGKKWKMGIEVKSSEYVYYHLIMVI
jgi:hypothetical protein